MVIIKADSTKELPLKSNSIDAIVTDPPYGLEFMGKKWDKLRNTWQAEKGRYHNDTTFLAKGDRIRYQAGMEMQLWHNLWIAEAYRVLKPGASMLVMGGTRTFHRLACAIEDAGFIIKDTLMWIYGSGFPKAQEASVLVDAKILGISTKEVKKRRKKIGINPNHRGESQYHNQFTKKLGQDGNISIPLTPLAKHWNGFKVGGVKPAYEPIIWAVKPPEGAYVDNVMKYAVGAVNVDETRISCNPIKEDLERGRKTGGSSYFSEKTKNPLAFNKGRFPANIILSHHPECVQVGVKRVKGGVAIRGNQSVSHFGNAGSPQEDLGYIAPDGFETVESWNCHPDCAVKMLDEQSGELKSGKDNVRTKEGFFVEHGKLGKAGDIQVSYGDEGGASRFFYCAKASTTERNLGLELMKDKMYGQSGGAQIALKKGESEYKQDHIGLNRIKRVKNDHPTVKPIALFQYLIKLVTREGQVVFDPFVGSGTTAIAALLSERKCIAIDNESSYLQIAKARIEYWSKLPSQLEFDT